MGIKTIVLLGTLGLALGSCNKQQDPVNSLTTSKTTADVLVQNGRLVFPTNDAFLRVQQSLSRMSTEQLTKWAADLKFTSLRELSQQPTEHAGAANLNHSFGFPSHIATLLNEKAEYQIGDRISWYHAGYRYVAHSEDELAVLKSNPGAATEKFAAGMILPTVSTSSASSATSQAMDPGITTTGQTNMSYVNSQSTNGDGKYGNYHFYLNRGSGDDPNSYRQLGFGTIQYKEDATDRMRPPLNGQRTVYTCIYINEYYELYLQRHDTWSRCDDYPRITSANLGASATLQGNNFYPYNNGSWGNQGASLSTSGSLYLSNAQHSGGDYPNTILQGYLASYNYDDFFLWSYEIQGTYSTRVSIDPNHVHTESGLLW